MAKSQIARQTAGAWSTTTDTGASQALGCSITAAAASARGVHNRHQPYQTPKKKIAYAIKLCSRFLTATNEVLRRVLFRFQSVLEPVLSESLATLLDVVVNFQPEVSCRLHAIVSKLCRFFSCLFETPPIPRLLYFENERE